MEKLSARPDIIEIHKHIDDLTGATNTIAQAVIDLSEADLITHIATPDDLPSASTPFAFAEAPGSAQWGPLPFEPPLYDSNPETGLLPEPITLRLAEAPVAPDYSLPTQSGFVQALINATESSTGDTWSAQIQWADGGGPVNAQVINLTTYNIYMYAWDKEKASALAGGVEIPDGWNEIVSYDPLEFASVPWETVPTFTVDKVIRSWSEEDPMPEGLFDGILETESGDPVPAGWYGNVPGIGWRFISPAETPETPTPVRNVVDTLPANPEEDFMYWLTQAQDALQPGLVAWRGRVWAQLMTAAP